MRFWPWEWGKPRFDVRFDCTQNKVVREVYYVADLTTLIQKLEQRLLKMRGSFSWTFWTDERQVKTEVRYFEIESIHIREPHGDVSEWEPQSLFWTLKRKKMKVSPSNQEDQS